MSVEAMVEEQIVAWIDITSMYCMMYITTDVVESILRTAVGRIRSLLTKNP